MGHYDQAKCLISYYGVTNETCWYETEGERSEDAYVDALGHHLVEAHWKYFTIDVKDQAECDKASHLHYEFLINRCSPKHYLPVMAVFRPSNKEESLGTHFYPKIQTAGKQNTCWITFLGAHGHCEAHNDKFDLYNSDDTPEGYAMGAGASKESQWQRLKMVMRTLPQPHPHIHILPRLLQPMKSPPQPHTKPRPMRAPPHMKLQPPHLKLQRRHMKPQQKLLMMSHQVTQSPRMATLVPTWVGRLLHLQWVAGMLLLPQMRNMSLRPLTTQVSLTSGSRHT